MAISLWFEVRLAACSELSIMLGQSTDTVHVMTCQNQIKVFTDF